MLVGKHSLHLAYVPPLMFFFFWGNPFRNNLTVIDAILLHGRGTTESLKVAGKPPGQGSSLRFKMTEALLKDCTESEFELWIGNVGHISSTTTNEIQMRCDAPSLTRAVNAYLLTGWMQIRVGLHLVQCFWEWSEQPEEGMCQRLYC